MLVVDSILADLDYAIANLPANKSVDQITRWTALALKSRVCLYEGTWRKYHADDVFGKDTQGQALTGWQELLQTCINDSEELMENGPYSIYLSSPDSAYHDLFASPETLSPDVILKSDEPTSNFTSLIPHSYS